MKKKSIIFFLLLSLIFSSVCYSQVPKQNARTTKTLTIAKKQIATKIATKNVDTLIIEKAPLKKDVYIIGQQNVSSKKMEFALLWKNGELVTLKDVIKHPSINEDASFASGISVSEGNVYILGTGLVSKIPGYLFQIKLWKNGEVSYISNGAYNALPTCISTYKKDVYIGGNETNANGKTVARIWKNGEPSNLSDGTINTEILALTVVGNDVYAAGNEGNNFEPKTLRYWKNGNAINLTDGKKKGSVAGIFVKNNDVYVVGYEENELKNGIVKLWINGILTNITDGLENAKPKGIMVSGNDVFICGYSAKKDGKVVAMLWKNGEPIKLSDGITNHTFAEGLFINGNDIHVVGYENANNMQKAKYWLNGIEQPLQLEDGYTSSSKAIFIK